MQAQSRHSGKIAGDIMGIFDKLRGKDKDTEQQDPNLEQQQQGQQQGGYETSQDMGTAQSRIGQQPQGGYDPNTGNQGYQDPNQGSYQDPNQGYQDPNQGYQNQGSYQDQGMSNQGYQDPNQGYQDPNQGNYQDPNQGRQDPNMNDDEYQDPNQDQNKKKRRW